MIDRTRRTLGLALALASCSQFPSTNEDQAAASDAVEAKRLARPKPFDGWGSFKFGMSFDDAFIAQAGVHWDGGSFRKCRDEMPISGCTLWASDDDSYLPLTAGVALLPHLSFNQKGELVTVDMTKRLRGDVKPVQCERAHGQLLDYLDSEWGPAQSRNDRSSKLLKRTTPKGRTFYRTAGYGPVFVMDVEDFNKLSDGRQITIISHYTAASEYSEADCWLSVYFDGPKSLERPPYEKPKELAEVPNDADVGDEPTAADEDPRQDY